MRAAESKTSPLCPSAQPDWDDAALIGIVEGTPEKPVVTPLRRPLPPSEEILRLASPVTPTEVFRFAAPCLSQGCLHFSDGKCRLAEKIALLLPPVTETLPKCAIRPRCLWWRQEGRAGCLRCLQVVTDNYNPSELMRVAATPGAKPGMGEAEVSAES
jgi:hypothetical protein